jgi:hypothetical protein
MDAIHEMSKKIFKEYHEKLEALTVEQFETALRQAISCGDFMTHTYLQDTGYFKWEEPGKISSPLQSVTYLPYRQVQDLKMEMGRYKMALEKIAYDRSPPWDKMDYQTVARQALKGEG